MDNSKSGKLSLHETERVSKALAGELAPEDLTERETVLFDIKIQEGISKKIGSVNQVERHLETGGWAVAMDDHGNIVKYFPDGSIELLKRGQTP